MGEVSEKKPKPTKAHLEQFVDVESYIEICQLWVEQLEVGVVDVLGYNWGFWLAGCFETRQTENPENPLEGVFDCESC